MDDTSRKQEPQQPAPTGAEKTDTSTEITRPEGEQQRPMRGRWLSPWEEMERMMDRFHELVPHSWRKGQLNWPEGWGNVGILRTPVVDIIDRDSEVVVRAEVPGMKKQDLDISLAGDSITIKGNSRQEKEEEKGDYYRKETSQEAFSRTLSLPAEVESDTARATFRDGVLEVVLSKKQPVPRSKIAIE